MNDEKRFDRSTLILAAILAAVVAFLIGRGTVPRPVEGVVEVHDTTTVVQVVHDTLTKYRDRTVARVDTLYLPAVHPDSSGVAPAVPDSAAVVVPIERVVVEGEHYTATLEGFRPRLVDMELRLPTQIITNTKTVTVQKRWSFVVGPQLGFGYGVGGFTPYVGVGVSFGYCF